MYKNVHFIHDLNYEKLKKILNLEDHNVHAINIYGYRYVTCGHCTCRGTL